MGRVNVNHFLIFDYWKEKIILKNGSIKSLDYITKNEEQLYDWIPVVDDWGEPSCWACGKPVVGAYEKKNEEDTNFEKLYTDKKVMSFYERCHIIPRALGGEDNPNNLFLMCKECHEKSPDTTNKEAFFRWVYNIRKNTSLGINYVELLESLNKEFTQRGYLEIQEIFQILEFEGVDIVQSKENVLDFLYKNLSTHRSKVANSSWAIVVCDYILQLVPNELLEKIKK